MNTFSWQLLPKPFLVLAPMENVTDTVFRHIVMKVARPDVFFTEFTNTDGLCSEGRERVGKRLQFTKDERPLIAQIWGDDPRHFFESAKLLKEMGFDGIDINMGCPVSKIIKKGSCSGLIRNPSLAKELIHATKEGAGSLPVSVKTRIGFKEFETEKWCGFLLEQNIAALSVHGRTVAEMSKVPAHWDEIGTVVEIRNRMDIHTVIIGNGDVIDYTDAKEKTEKFGVDGVMIGRGIFQNLLAFDKTGLSLSQKKKLELLQEHVSLYTATWRNEKPFDVLKKYVKIYTLGMPDAADFRMSLMECKTADELLEKVDKKLRTY